MLPTTCGVSSGEGLLAAAPEAVDVAAADDVTVPGALPPPPPPP